MELYVGQYKSAVSSALAEMDAGHIVQRIWAKDHTVWKPDPVEICNRLGWLDIAKRMLDDLPRFDRLVGNLLADGYTKALLLGMGGSSLAPQVFRRTFGVKDGYLDLDVLDSTDPAAVLEKSEGLDLERTVFIVSTKSGRTVETLSFFKYFFNLVREFTNPDNVGRHFIAITDAGSRLDELAARHNFREVYLNDQNIGGRYSALSYFGLVPAALIGVDLERLLHRSINIAGSCQGDKSAIGKNPCSQLGATLGVLAKAGRDKVTFIASPGLESFGDWVEQLIAESTGKDGVGILPVTGEPLGKPEVYGSDRLFVHLKLEQVSSLDNALTTLVEAGQPVLRIMLQDKYDIGGQFFLWEMATAIAGSLLDINPFDQPNVEAAKVLARQMVSKYQASGHLPEESPIQSFDGVAVYGEPMSSDQDNPLAAFLSTALPGDYVALQAYLLPTPEIDSALLAIRQSIREHTKLAVTSGYGPRFLHSTGQLHKGDAGRGLFIQFTSDIPIDVDIPDEPGSEESSMSFGVLEASQAMGDRQALRDAGRRVIRFHFSSDVPEGIAKITKF